MEDQSCGYASTVGVVLESNLALEPWGIESLKENKGFPIEEIVWREAIRSQQK